MEKISLLIPFRSDQGGRDRLWRWLKSFWENELPEAEIIIGESSSIPFSKTEAINEAFERSTGDIIVILDADAYLKGSVIRHCARRLRHARRHGARTWFVPYTRMFRLDPFVTEDILSSDPKNPIWPECNEESHDGSGPKPTFANYYGALIQIFPREAFEMVGGMCEDFKGWGGEDISFLRTLDTLWGKHKNIPRDVYHLFHPKVIGNWRKNPWVRVWPGQVSGSNDELATRYQRATGNIKKMWNLIERKIDPT